jgi:hypothetical protein
MLLKRQARENYLCGFHGYLSSVSVSESFRMQDTRARQQRGITSYAEQHQENIIVVVNTWEAVHIQSAW